jgi:hypothetical protein
MARLVPFLDPGGLDGLEDFLVGPFMVVVETG